MHRECAECPFVLQLLAAKRCNSGNYLLLLEYATQGTLTDVIAARRLQLQRSSSKQHLQLPAPATADSGSNTAVVVPTAEDSKSCVEEHPVQIVAAASASDDAEVAAILPLAVTAAHVVEDDERQTEKDMQLNTTLLQQQQQCPGLYHKEPVLVTLLQDSSATAPELLQESLKASQGTAAAVTQLDATYGINMNELHPVSHGLSEESAKFYAACILMGLRTLHSRRILHR